MADVPRPPGTSSGGRGDPPFTGEEMKGELNKAKGDNGWGPIIAIGVVAGMGAACALGAWVLLLIPQWLRIVLCITGGLALIALPIAIRLDKETSRRE